MGPVGRDPALQSLDGYLRFIPGESCWMNGIRRGLDSRLKARFQSYRLNLPRPDESTTLLTVDDFQAMLSRPVPPREGLPIIGLDLGGSRAWSAALALFRNGRIEARALAPGIPDLADQEVRDMVPPGTYQRLSDEGVLIQASGLRVPRLKMLVSLIQETWGRPACLILDRFRLDEIRDAGVPFRVVPRVTRWSEASYDIRALRSKTKDGPFAVAECSRSLLGASLSVATVKNDDQGSCRIEKRGTNNTARDDVASAFALAAGAFARSVDRTRASASLCMCSLTRILIRRHSPQAVLPAASFRNGESDKGSGDSLRRIVIHHLSLGSRDPLPDGPLRPQVLHLHPSLSRMRRRNRRQRFPLRYGRFILPFGLPQGYCSSSQHLTNHCDTIRSLNKRPEVRMLESQKLALRASEIRTKLAEFAGKRGSWGEDERAEIAKFRNRVHRR